MNILKSPPIPTSRLEKNNASERLIIFTCLFPWKSESEFSPAIPQKFAKFSLVSHLQPEWQETMHAISPEPDNPSRKQLPEPRPSKWNCKRAMPDIRDSFAIRRRACSDEKKEFTWPADNVCHGGDMYNISLLRAEARFVGRAKGGIYSSLVFWSFLLRRGRVESCGLHGYMFVLVVRENLRGWFLMSDAISC